LQLVEGWENAKIKVATSASLNEVSLLPSLLLVAKYKHGFDIVFGVG
jgi:hypothetical protein